MSITKNDPVRLSDVEERANEIVALQQSGIVWHPNNVPFPEFPASYFAWTNGVSTGFIKKYMTSGDALNADALYNYLNDIMNLNTAVRYLRALRYKTGNSSGVGYTYDNTQLASMNANYAYPRGTLSRNGSYPSWIDGRMLSAGELVHASTVIGLLNRARGFYGTHTNSIVTIQINVCYSDCYVNPCYRSRGRR